MKNFLKFISVSLMFTPVIAFAQSTSGVCTGVPGFNGILCRIDVLFSNILPLLISLGVLYFIWGVVQYFIGGGEEAKTKGKDRIIYGIIGLAVIISIWGLVNILVSTFGAAGSAPDTSTLITTTTASSSCTVGTKLQGVLDYFTCLIAKSVIPFLFALAVLMFIWGTINFLIINSDEEAKRNQGKQFMIWGIIALAVMISVWGLVRVVGDTFNLPTNVLPEVKP